MKIRCIAFLLIGLLVSESFGIFFPMAGVGGGAALIATSVNPNILSIAAAAGAAKLLGLGALALLSKKKEPEEDHYSYSSYGSPHRSYNRHRYRRSAVQQDPDTLLKIIQQLEPEDCMKKMICDLAALGQEENPILIPFNGQSENNGLNDDSSEDLYLEYKVAAKVGNYVKDVKSCEVVYKCSISSSHLVSIASL
eukprot:TRINITY_DN22210_c0_g1_i1.p1 TRINITY_DN22210_c0_g1~~TRINITY_DN22210_c0_g1_i1.p1  ORF type:complete len:195 (+),score=38.80 TRINITY_DN22210_c0_g1_i1:34-618(+)